MSTRVTHLGYKQTEERHNWTRNWDIAPSLKLYVYKVCWSAAYQKILLMIYLTSLIRLHVVPWCSSWCHYCRVRPNQVYKLKSAFSQPKTLFCDKKTETKFIQSNFPPYIQMFPLFRQVNNTTLKHFFLSRGKPLIKPFSSIHQNENAAPLVRDPSTKNK